MKPLALLLGVMSATLTACGVPDDEAREAALPWQPVARVAFDPTTGQTAAVALPQSDDRVALRISAAPDGDRPICLQVVGAMDASGEALAQPFAGSECVECAWRTAMIQQTGVLVLEGVAEGLTRVTFGRVDCRTQARIEGGGDVTVERLETPRPPTPAIALRVITTTGADLATLADDVSRELAGIAVEVVSTISIAERELRLDGRGDIAALAALVGELPPRDEGVIDVVIGPCLIREDPFGTRQLAGLTPRIPGGAGPADAVFISRQSCGSREATPDRPDARARLVAHELGHYLGLFHPEEEDGTEDEFADTAVENLMHRFPLLRLAQGLSDAQYARIIAHPFVR